MNAEQIIQIATVPERGSTYPAIVALTRDGRIFMVCIIEGKQGNWQEIDTNGFYPRSQIPTTKLT